MVSPTLQKALEKARQRFENARTILREKANLDDDYYLEKKYVKMAGREAYAGMLLALDKFINVRTSGRRDVYWYEEHLSCAERKVQDTFDSAYRVLYVAMGRKGIGNAEMAEIGIRRAEQVVDWIECQPDPDPSRI